jgi:hypothetical protein
MFIFDNYPSLSCMFQLYFEDRSEKKAYSVDQKLPLKTVLQNEK